MQKLNCLIWLCFPLLIIFALAGCQPAEAVTEENQTEVEAARPEPEAEEPVIEEPEPVNIKVDSLIPPALKAVLTQAARQAFDSFEMVEGQSGYDVAVSLGPGQQHRFHIHSNGTGSRFFYGNRRNKF
ncbi:MAG: hypothetical protein U5N58_12735 [Actinomycetota bacterium]|nr:hypothetical protein [Actinomycetota bacterium]